MMNYFDNLKNLIDENGKFIGTPKEKKDSIKAVEELAKSLLGAMLCVRENKFIIRMLEVYYGGIGDCAHDWYRTNFLYKKSKFKEQTNVQNDEGFRIYLSSMDIEDTYTRFDIVVGHEGVPVSLLIRSVWDSNFERIGTKKGNPNIVLKSIGLKSDDHGKKIGFNDNNCEIYIEDTSDEIKKQKGLEVKQQKRIGPESLSYFEKMNGLEWNFYLEKP